MRDDKGDQSLEIAVHGSLILDELELVIQAALDGTGLAWVAEDRVAVHIASRALVRVLEDWCPPFPGFPVLPESQAAAGGTCGSYRYASPG